MRDLPDDEPKPTSNPTRVPSLDATQRFGGGRQRGELDAEIERELAEAMGDANVEQLLNAPALRQRKEAGGTPGKHQGRVLRIHGPDVFIEVPGGRSQGVVALQQFEDKPPKVGDIVEVAIIGAADGQLVLSLQGAAMVADWTSVKEGMIVEAKALSVNKGGLTVDVNGIRGFMPIGQIDLYRVENAESFVNQKLRCFVIDVDPLEKNLVVSRKALLEKERAEIREKVWEELAEGQVREGIVRSVREFGAFVDIGGVDGLLPISQMSWSRVEKAEDIVQVGMKVKVVVLRMDKETRKLSFGLKQLSASPWDDVIQRYSPGNVVTGKVSRLADFGAFVELEPAIEGLIHISELAPQRVFRAKDIVQVDQVVKVLVVSVDAEQRRIGLSLKQALAKDAPAAEEEEDETWTPPPPRPRNPNLKGGVG